MHPKWDFLWPDIRPDLLATDFLVIDNSSMQLFRQRGHPGEPRFSQGRAVGFCLRIACVPSDTGDFRDAVDALHKFDEDDLGE